MSSGDDPVAEYVAVLRAFGLDDDDIVAATGLDAVPDVMSLPEVLAHEREDHDPGSLHADLLTTLADTDRGIDSPREFWDHAPGNHLAVALSAFDVSIALEGAHEDSPGDFVVEIEADGERRTETVAYPDTPLGDRNYPAIVAAVEDLLPVPVSLPLLDGPEDRWQFVAVADEDLAALRGAYGERVAPFGEPLLAERQPADYRGDATPAVTPGQNPEPAVSAIAVTPAEDPAPALSPIAVTPGGAERPAISRIAVTPGSRAVPAVAPIRVTPAGDPAPAVEAVESREPPTPSDDATATAAAAGDAYAETVETGPRTTVSETSIEDDVAAATEGVQVGSESVDEVFEEFDEDSPEEIAAAADDDEGAPSGTTGTVTRAVDDDVASLLGDLSEESLSAGGPTTAVSDREVDASAARIDAGGPRKVVADTSIDDIFDDIEEGAREPRDDHPSDDDRKKAADAAAAAVENTLNDEDPVKTDADGLRGGGPQKTVVEDDIDGLFDDVDEGIPASPAEMDTETDYVDAVLDGTEGEETVVDDDVDPGSMRDVNAVGGGPKRVVASESVDEIFAGFAEDSPAEIAESADEPDEDADAPEPTPEDAADEDLDEAFADLSDDVPEPIEPTESPLEDGDDEAGDVPAFAELMDEAESEDVSLADEGETVPDIELDVPEPEETDGGTPTDRPEPTGRSPPDAPPAPGSGTRSKSPGDDGSEHAPDTSDAPNLLTDTMTDDERDAADVEEEETEKTTHVGDLDLSMDDVEETSVPSRTAETSDGEASDVETGGTPGSIAVDPPAEEPGSDDDSGGFVAKLRSLLPF